MSQHYDSLFAWLFGKCHVSKLFFITFSRNVLTLNSCWFLLSTGYSANWIDLLAILTWFSSDIEFYFMMTCSLRFLLLYTLYWILLSQYRHLILNESTWISVYISSVFVLLSYPRTCPRLSIYPPSISVASVSMFLRHVTRLWWWRPVHFQKQPYYILLCNTWYSFH